MLPGTNEDDCKGKHPTRSLRPSRVVDWGPRPNWPAAQDSQRGNLAHFDPVITRAAARGSGTLLLVEDDSSLLGMCDQMLRSLGYNVLAAGTPEAALRLADEHADEIRLMVTDVVMPGMNGGELAGRLKVHHPNLKCLFMSGFTADMIARQGIMDGSDYFIQKPFSLKALAAKVREVLVGA